MDPPQVRAASVTEIEQVLSTLVLGFAADPVVRWHFPESESYLSVMPRFALTLGGGAFESGTALLADGGHGAALWMPPGTEPDYDALGTLVEEALRPFPDLARDFAEFVDQASALHIDEPHWYLPLIAVDPHWHGRGIGSALLEHMLERCDAEQALAYLEASTPRNISLYQRHGFEILGQIQAGSSPVMTPMLRRPR